MNAELGTKAALSGRVRAVTGHLHKTFWTLWLGTLINRLGSVVLPFLGIYLTANLQLTAAQAGTVAAAYGLGSMIAGPLGGALADRIGRRPVIIGGLLAGGSITLLFGHCHGYLQVVLCAAVLGVASDLYRPAFFSAVADVVPPVDRPRAYGLLYWVLNVGFAVAMPIAGVVSARSPRLLFYLDAATTFSFAAMMWKWLPETFPTQLPHRSTARSASESLLMPLRDSAFVTLQVPFFATAIVLFQSQMALSLDLTAHGHSPATFGMLLSLNSILIVIAQPAILPIVSRFARPVALAAGAALVGLGFGLHAFPSSFPLAATAVAVWTLGDMVQQSVMPAVIADIAPKASRATYEGASFMVFGLAGCVAPGVGGHFIGRYGGNMLWLSCLLLGLGSTMGYLSLRHRWIDRIAAQRDRTKEDG